MVIRADMCFPTVFFKTSHLLLSRIGKTNVYINATYTARRVHFSAFRMMVEVKALICTSPTKMNLHDSSLHHSSLKTNRAQGIASSIVHANVLIRTFTYSIVVLILNFNSMLVQ